MRVPEPGEGLLIRLDEVSSRLADLAVLEPPPGLTDPDPRSGERWEWGQVWAHIAEFPRYWMNEIRAALEQADGEPVRFGRVATDPARIEAIERDRRTPVPVLWEKVVGDLDDLRVLLGEMTSEKWDRRGGHSTLGVMAMDRIFDEFLVGHLEEHADQLESMAAG